MAVYYKSPQSKITFHYFLLNNRGTLVNFDFLVSNTQIDILLYIELVAALLTSRSYVFEGVR